jgi:Serine dehydrogenase proteinase
MIEYQVRKKLFAIVEKQRRSKVIAYVTGDRRGLETQISNEVIDLFVEHLDSIQATTKISLLLYTNGGNTSTAWRLVNLLQIFCEELEVIIISKALSAGTLISLGANKIVMTKQAALGPIDPSLNHVLNPIPPQLAHVGPVPVSVEAVKGYLDAAVEFGIQGETQKTQILVDLANKVHPLVLGQIFRTSSQIRFLAKKLLGRQVADSSKADKIIDFLCAESGSHDYTINRREAKNLGLNIENPTENFYNTLKTIHASYIKELQLLEPYNASNTLGANDTLNYSFPRAIIESKLLGCHQFLSQGTLFKNKDANGIVVGISDQRSFEGWSKVA